MIIDAHCHVDIRFGWVHTPEVLLSMMDSCNIDKSLVTSYADLPCADDPDSLQRFLNAVDTNKARILGGYFRANPWFKEKAISLFREAIAGHNIIGLKIHPVSIVAAPSSPLVIDLIKEASRHGAPTLVHTGDEPNALPHHVEKAGRECSDAIIIMAHMGGNFYWKDAIRVAKENKNIFLDTSGIPSVNAIQKAVDELGPERIIFGSDAPAMDPSVEITKIERLNLGKTDEEKVFAKNILNILPKR
ncbi:MAG: amidohydrolase family protein [Conexivisphaerales archaeon]